jgi:hypothetical protein
MVAIGTIALSKALMEPRQHQWTANTKGNKRLKKSKIANQLCFWRLK